VKELEQLIVWGLSKLSASVKNSAAAHGDGAGGSGPLPLNTSPVRRGQGAGCAGGRGSSDALKTAGPAPGELPNLGARLGGGGAPRQPGEPAAVQALLALDAALGECRGEKLLEEKSTSSPMYAALEAAVTRSRRSPLGLRALCPREWLCGACGMTGALLTSALPESGCHSGAGGGDSEVALVDSAEPIHAGSGR
jgi:hypothetical protein